jgi:hypothetical protein
MLVASFGKITGVSTRKKTFAKPELVKRRVFPPIFERNN